MKLPILCHAFLFIASSLHGATMYLSEDFVGIIPDGSIAGLSSNLALSRPGETIASITVDFSLTGHNGSPFLGDLYVYLTDGTTLVTLLNRPGRDLDRPDGYSDEFGVSIIFSDAATIDAHLYRMEATGDNDTALSAPLLGLFQPDGRNTDPLSVLASTPRTSLLSDFNGLDAERNFTLFAADLSTGAEHQIESWGLTIQTIPEPSHTLLVLVAAGACFFRRKRA